MTTQEIAQATVTAAGAAPVGKMTVENLKAAFAGESQAHVKYLISAQKAQAEGLPNVARLFEALAFAEFVHATNHFKALGNLGATADNLQAAVGGETFEVQEMYPAYIEVAKLQGQKSARRSMYYAIEAEKVHADLYQQALQAVQQGSDAQAAAIYICDDCGHTVVGTAPDKCPLCGASREHYRTF